MVESYYQKNRERLLAKQRTYYHANRESILAKLHAEYDPRERKAKGLRLIYGITIEEYEAKAESQNWACDICKEPETAMHKSGKKMNLSVDHSHKTKAVRGLLCSNCNTALGKFMDSVTNLENAIEYLNKWS